jgi:polysaccharide pyruvyl transferase WcaK-like protein
MPELKNTLIVNPREAVCLISSVDLIVFGGGPLMASIDQIAEMDVISQLAKKHRVPSIIAGCGVGPLGDKWHNESIKNILSASALRFYRDSKSRDLAAALGVNVDHDIIVEDPAFTWLKNQKNQLISKPSIDHKVLLLGLRDFPFTQYAGHMGMEEGVKVKVRFERRMLNALNKLTLQHPDMVIRPLPMCTNHFGGDDRWFYRRLFRDNIFLQGKLDLSLLGAELSPLDYCEAFSGAHVVLAMRFHSLVFALGLDIPAIAVDYTLGQGKVKSLAQKFSVPFKSLTDIDANFIVNEVNLLLNNPKAQGVGFDPIFTEEMKHKLPKIMINKGISSK